MKTIKQIADEIGVTKAALQKRIGRGRLHARLSPYISTQAGTKYIDEQGEIIIKQSFEEKPFIASISPSIDTSIPVNKGAGIGGDTHDTPLKIDNLDNNLIELLREQQADLRRQLEIKDKQIDDLNNRLAESNAALVSAQQTVQAEQALHAGTIQSRLLSDEQEKQSLWSKIFKKKNQ